MRKLSRIVSVLFVLVLLTGTLSACHGARGMAGFTVPDEFDDGKEITLTFWAKNDTNIRQTEVYKKAVEDFQRMYPNVTIKLRLFTDYAKIYQEVLNNIQTQTTPNICISYPDHIATYMTSDNLMISMDELFADEKFGLGGSDLRYDGPTREEMIPYFLDEGILAGHYYALPFMRSTEACYINQDIVEALGYEVPEVLTWDYIWEVSRAATQKDENGLYVANGKEKMYPFIYKSTDNMTISYLKQKDAGYSTEEGTIEIFNDDMRELMLTVADNVTAGAFTSFKAIGYPADRLNVSECIFAIDSTAGATWMGTNAPLTTIPDAEFDEFTLAVRPIPQVDPEKPQMISQGPSICLFNNQDPQVVLASWLFAQYLLTNEVQIPYSQTEGYCPVTTKALESAEYQDYLSRAGEDNDLYYQVKIDATRLLLDNIDNTFTTPVFNGSASLRQAAGELLEKAIADARHKKTVDDFAVNTMFENVTKQYHLEAVEALNSNEGLTDLGPLPAEAKLLLFGIAALWLVVAVNLVYVAKTKKRPLD